MSHICFNGKIVPAGEPVLLAANRGYRYGDGLFETIKLQNGQLLLKAYHFDRLFSGLSVLKFKIPTRFTRERLEDEILHLCRKNECEGLARVRLSVSRGNGGLYDEEGSLQYLIECWPLNPTVNSLNENGLVIDVYTGGEKSCDQFANLKTANFLIYSMAAIYAKENKLNDCLVLNNSGSIADSTTANLFLVKKDNILTPEAGEGCVEGVMRRWLLENLRKEGYKVNETTITVNDIKQADELFLTNAIHGIRWVKQFRDKTYPNSRTTEIYQQFVKTIPV
ncbi:MAG: aminotransferase class IV [Chitinophagaceae bacterium]